MSFIEVVEIVGKVIDGVGVAIIAIGAVVAAGIAVGRLFGKFGARATGERSSGTYRTFREQLGRSILLGLEFLVAADIINTVAIEPTIQSLLILGGIVLIRTFLSFSLEVEIEGRWPWARHRSDDERPSNGTA